MAIIITQTGCSKKPDFIEKKVNSENPVSGDSFHLDTPCQITIYETKNEITEAEATKLIDRAFRVCDDYEKLMSKTIETSDISKINNAGGEPVKCSPRTIEVIQKGIKYGKLSEGLFDITVGKETELWHFGDETKQTVPDDADLLEAAKHVDYRKIKVNTEENTVQLEDPEMQIDLGGIAKGYISDKVSEYLEEKGVTGAIINLGGNISAEGYKNGKDSEFHIGIRKPFSEKGELTGSLPLSNGTIVTSGLYERSFNQNGKFYHHILDPKTGLPVNTDIYGVTIKGKKGTSCDCDALATICTMLGSKKGLEFIEKQKGYEAVFVLEDDTLLKTKNLKGFKGQV